MGKVAALSLPLLLLDRNLVYSQSLRPKTDMLMFRQPNSRTISRSEIVSFSDNRTQQTNNPLCSIVSGQILIDGEKWNVVPVTRYGLGMSCGLYHGGDRPADAIGTFYYLEPESTTYLAYKTELRAFNKTEACLSLGVPNREQYNITETLKHSRGIYPRDLMMTPLEVTRARRISRPSQDVDPQPRYAGVYLGLYGNEDVFDQDLAKTASATGYDIVVLESMVGRYQVVTEILDTRPREESFSRLLYIED